MMDLAHVDRRELLDVLDQVRGRLRAAPTLEAAAQEVVTVIAHAFASSVVLSRLFLTVPFGKLPDEQRRAAWHVAEAQSLQSRVNDRTPVLTLLGTYGKHPDWCDRRTSRGHAAIPLCSQVFVDSIPMVARMLQEMGVDLGLVTNGDPYVDGSGWVGLFYVEDARTARDDQGRRIIPASDFIEQHSVRTVFGIGKAYANGSIASFVVFANKVLSRERVETLIPMINAFKAETMDHMALDRIFSKQEPVGDQGGL